MYPFIQKQLLNFQQNEAYCIYAFHPHRTRNGQIRFLEGHDYNYIELGEILIIFTKTEII